MAIETEQSNSRVVDDVNTVTPRIKALSNAYYESIVHICPQRSHLATVSWKETEGQPLVIRRAKLFSEICEEIPVAIFDNELIVGSQTAYLRGTGLQLDYSSYVGLQIEDGDRRLKAEQATGILNENDLRTIIEDTYYWKDRSPGEIMLQQIREVMGTIYEDITYDMSIRAYARSTSYTPFADYEKVLKIGLKGIIAEIDNELVKIQFTAPGDGQRYQFLQAAKICCQAEIRLAKRYAQLALNMAAKEPDSRRKSELQDIAQICEHVPENPARTFWEALQSVRLIHLGLYMEDGNGGGAILGRMDQYLYPFYQKDIEQGTLSRQKAAELLGTFWVKIAAMEMVLNIYSRNSASGFVGSRIVLAGLDKDGRDASNELTYLILHVAGQMKMLVPLYFRWHSGIDRNLMLKAVWANIQIGSEPAFYNDEQIIPGLIADGASVEDARNYILWGCSQPYPFGSIYGTVHYINGGKILELVMNNGFDPIVKKQIGIKTGDPSKFTSIEDWIIAYGKQWDHIYNIVIKGFNIGELAQMEIYSQPFASALIADCIQNGKGVHQGGTRYPQFGEDIFHRVYADVPDSLVAINNLVYKDRKITISEALDACANNFEGTKGDSIRKLLISSPKFGNDMGEPEEIYRNINEHIAITARSCKSHFGYFKRDLKNGASIHFSHGQVVGALPNGRKSGMPFADGGISPCAGCDIKGPTVTLRSVFKALDYKLNRSSILNQKIPRDLIKTKESRNKFIDLIEIFFKDYKGTHIQWNIADQETYKEAKINPKLFNNLIVRVGGYSAYFIDLHPILQDEIIGRTEQSI